LEDSEDIYNIQLVAGADSMLGPIRSRCCDCPNNPHKGGRCPNKPDEKRGLVRSAKSGQEELKVCECTGHPSFDKKKARR